VAALVFVLCASAQDLQVRKALPVEEPPFKEAVPQPQEPALVNVRLVIPDIVVELRYKTKKNITRQVLYPENMPCMLHPATLEKLRIAQDIVRAQGYGLKIWDAWRPPEVQLSLFNHGGYTGMFTDPKIMWSRHCSGTAVDVTLVDAKGRELEMPTGFDTGGRDAHYVYKGKDKDIRMHLHVLQMAMLDAGFSILDNEWWHFDDRDYNFPRASPPVVFGSDLGLALPKVRLKTVAR